MMMMMIAVMIPDEDDEGVRSWRCVEMKRISDERMLYPSSRGVTDRLTVVRRETE
jgi:hypothetical protein